MNNNSFINLIKNNGMVIIFGAGKRGVRLAKLFKELDVTIKFFCDNNPEKHGKVIIDNIKCISYNELKMYKDAVIILSMLDSEGLKSAMQNDKFEIIMDYNDISSYFVNELVQCEEYPYLSDNIKFKDKHKGQRCFIVGNGPSIKNQDLSLLKDEITFTVNFISRNEQFKDIHTNYHFFADPLIFNIENEELITDIKAISQYSPYVDCFVPYYADAKEFCQDIFGKNNNIGFNYFVPYEYNTIFADLTRPIKSFFTVVQYAVVAAIYMGFSEIYLLGCDCTDIMNNVEACTQNHISGKYYGYSVSSSIDNHIKKSLQFGFENIFRGYSRWFADYKKIDAYCHEHNIVFKNCTDGGILDCVERAKYEDIIKEKRV